HQAWDALSRFRTWLRYGRGLPPGFITFQMTTAAVLAYVVALQVSGNATPILAPLTALLISEATAYATIRKSLDRVGAVVPGVLFALGISVWTGLTWWSLGIAIFGSILIGRLLRLGPFLPEAAISAMLVLGVGG